MKINKWIIAARPWSFPASAMPVVVAVSYIFWQWKSGGESLSVEWWNSILCLFGAVVFQAAGNVISDYFDYKFHVDSEESFGSSRVLIDGLFSPRTLFIYGMAILALAVLIGIYLLSCSGIHLLWIGVVGLFGTYFYYLLKYRAFGDLIIFVIYGELIALGTVYVMTDVLNIDILFVSMPTGFLIVNILHANNTRDILFDRKAGIHTFAMLLGVNASKVQYAILAVGSYLMVVIMVISGLISPISLSVLITLPLAVRNIKCMSHALVEQPERIKSLDGMSAQLVLAFSVCLAVSNVVAGLLI